MLGLQPPLKSQRRLQALLSAALMDRLPVNRDIAAGQTVLP